MSVETKYDNEKNAVIIGRSIEVFIPKGEYEAIQRVTNGRFGDFYKEDNLGKIRVGDGNIIYLDLSGLELGVLDSCIGGLSSLEELRVNDNKLTSLPKSISELGSLRVIYVTKDQLDDRSKSLLSELIWRDVRVCYI